jgi:hypothetical protein
MGYLLKLVLSKNFPVVLPLQDRQVRQSFKSSPKGAAQSNSSSKEGEGAKCRLLDFTQSEPSPYIWEKSSTTEGGTKEKYFLNEKFQIFKQN